MKCNNCQVTFNPRENAELGGDNSDSVEVKTACPQCGFRYYTFTVNWVSDEDANKFIAAQREKRVARTKVVSLLKKDDLVVIYHDPITWNKPEGTALLVECVDTNPAKNRWLVRFEHGRGPTVVRDIVPPFIVIIRK